MSDTTIASYKPGEASILFASIESTGHATNTYTVANDGNLLLHIYNSGANTPNVIIKANAQVGGKSIGSDETIALAANEIRQAGPYRPELWNNTSGLIQVAFSGSNETEAKICWVRCAP